MAPAAAIQSFFPPSSSPSRSIRSSPSPSTSDPAHLPIPDPQAQHPPVTTNKPLHVARPWSPQQQYTEADITALFPGLRWIKLTARIVNLHQEESPIKAPWGARGCVKMIVKDDTGALVVHLWYASVEYQLRLGHLVSIWASHVSTCDSASISVITAPLFVSLFPERDRSCHLLIREHEHDVETPCRTPLGLSHQAPLENLFTLRSFLNGGHKISDARILVVVKSLGPKKKVTTRYGATKETRNVVVYDHTAYAVLGLWGSLQLSSTDQWNPSETILLVTRATCNVSYRPYISLTAASYIDVDPLFEDADWLRSYVKSLTKHQHVNYAFPERAFSLDQWLQSDAKTLLSLSEIDDFVRLAPHEPLIAYLSVILLDLRISLLHTRAQLFSSECCSVPVYDNTLLTICKHCQTPVMLRLNPKIVGVVLDETGSIGAGRLVWSSTAWTELFGRSEQALSEMRADGLRYLERRMTGLRISLIIGWAGARSDDVGGLLCVLGVRA